MFGCCDFAELMKKRTRNEKCCTYSTWVFLFFLIRLRTIVLVIHFASLFDIYIELQHFTWNSASFGNGQPHRPFMSVYFVLHSFDSLRATRSHTNTHTQTERFKYFAEACHNHTRHYQQRFQTESITHLVLYQTTQFKCV